MKKGAENYGNKVYSYLDYETMRNDVLNDDPSNAYSSSSGGTLDDSDPNNNFNSGTIEGIYDKYSINDLASSLESSLGNASGFFQLAYNVIPREYMSIIVAGAAILIILRVLGR